MKKFRVKVNDKIYEVEVEELGGDTAQSVQTQSISHPKPKSASQPVKKQAPVPTKSKEVSKPKPKPAPSSGGEEIKAPMPGKILEVRAKEGDSVNEGDVLLILEAMKMENEIMAPTSGTVKGVYASVGQMVESDDLLVVLG